MAVAYAACGSTLGLGSTNIPASATYTEIAQVSTIGGPAMVADSIDTSDLNSCDKKFIAGQRDLGEVSMDLFFDPADATHSSAAGLLSVFLSGDERAYELKMSDAANTVWQFVASVTGFETAFGVGDAITASVTLRTTGALIVP